MGSCYCYYCLGAGVGCCSCLGVGCCSCLEVGCCYCLGVGLLLLPRGGLLLLPRCGRLSAAMSNRAALRNACWIKLKTRIFTLLDIDPGRDLHTAGSIPGSSHWGHSTQRCDDRIDAQPASTPCWHGGRGPQCAVWLTRPAGYVIHANSSVITSHYSD